MRPKTTKIRLVHTDTLSCEPILRRMPDGSLLCVSQCGGITEPALENRVFAFQSLDEGESWEKIGSIYPETGEAVIATEVMVLDGVVSIFLAVHNGRFLNMRCVVMQSRDSGKTWANAGQPPHFPTFCFIRSMLPLKNGEIILPCQYFPITAEENARLILSNHNISNIHHQRAMEDAGIDHVGVDFIISSDRGQTFGRVSGPRFSIKGDTGRAWVWNEPTLAQLSDGTIVMFLRVDGSGCLWRSESKDNGRTWSEAVKTDIPNPGNKPKLIPLPDGRIALIHTPNSNTSFNSRNPLSLWISDDDLESFSDQRIVTDFPGIYCYPDGFQENGHILFTLEINRHDILFFDCEV